MQRLQRVLAARSDVRAGLWVKNALPLLVGAGCIWLASRQIANDDLVTIPARLAAIRPVEWGLAMMLTIISLMAAGRYDVIAMRHLRRPVHDDDAHRSGMVAIALAQATGFAPVVATFARWRQLPGLGFGTALAVGAFSAFSFIFGLLLFVGLLSFFPATGINPLVGTGAAIFAWAVFVASALRPPGLGRFNVALPSLTSLVAILGWTLVDLLAAAGVFWVFLPADAAISFALVLPVFAMAIGASILTSVPGGFGPFELVCLALLPQVPAGDLLAAVLAYRVTYIALPALVAVGCLAQPRRPVLVPPVRDAPWARDLLPAECQLAPVSGGGFEALGAGAAALQETPQSVVAMFDMLGSAPPLDAFCARARSVGKLPLIYRCNGALALSVRAQGWRVLRVGDEALLDLRSYTLDAPGRRRLRRKLSRFARAGGRIDMPPRIDFDILREVQRAWCTRNGNERGFTLGRFSADHLAGQAVVLAYRDDRVVGYASFHVTPDEICLDLLRPLPDAPDGCAFALVQHAIECAASAGITRCSLAAVPRAIPFLPIANKGLFQFKDAFQPHWSPRYAAAPSWLTLGISLADVLRENAWPRPIDPQDMNEAHQYIENYEFDPK